MQMKLLSWRFFFGKLKPYHIAQLSGALWTIFTPSPSSRAFPYHLVTVGKSPQPFGTENPPHPRKNPCGTQEGLSSQEFSKSEIDPQEVFTRPPGPFFAYYILLII